MPAADVDADALPAALLYDDGAGAPELPCMCGQSADVCAAYMAGGGGARDGCTYDVLGAGAGAGRVLELYNAGFDLVGAGAGARADGAGADP